MTYRASSFELFAAELKRIPSLACRPEGESPRLTLAPLNRSRRNCRGGNSRGSPSVQSPREGNDAARGGVRAVSRGSYSCRRNAPRRDASGNEPVAAAGAGKNYPNAVRAGRTDGNKRQKCATTMRERPRSPMHTSHAQLPRGAQIENGGGGTDRMDRNGGCWLEGGGTGERSWGLRVMN